MKKNWIRFIGFIAVFILFFIWFNKAYSIEVPAWSDFYKLPRNSIDVIFIGNSHTNTAFQPQIVNDLLDINTYLLGIPGENIPITYFELRELLKYQKPKMVVLESFPMNFTDLVIPPIIFYFTDSGFWDSNKLHVLAMNLNRNNLYTAFPVLHNSIDWNTPSKNYQKMISVFTTKTAPIDPALGYVRIPIILTANEMNTAIRTTEADSKTSLDENLKYLNKFVNLCEKKNVQLLLTTVPPIKIFGDSFKYYVPFDAEKYATENQIEYLKFNVSDMNELHYSDPSHMNDFGSVNISIQAAQAISKKMGIPINQDKLSYYNTFLFSGYTLIQKGEQYTFNLIPKDVNAPLEYQFVVKTNSDGQVITSTDWQSSNQIQFLLPDSSTYTLGIQVRNQQGDFKVSGDLQVTTN